MKTRLHIFPIALICFTFFALVFTGCEESIVAPTVPELVPISADTAAAGWTPMLVKATTYAMPTFSADVTAELATVRDLVSKRTAQQSSAISYWSGGSVQRWNEIACQLVAKYNVAPVAERNTDGSFTGKFITKPNTPFSNPPFAVRAYALLSVAQYDALIHCWKEKKNNPRIAPALQDPTILSTVHLSDLSCYPSEDATIAVVSCEVLAKLFPLERDYLESMAMENMQSRVWAGANFPSDLVAGDSIARAVAREVLDYASKDKFSNSNNQAEWNAIEPTRVTKWPRWKCQEFPVRPPMLPLFGAVVPWHVSDITTVRPGEPPTEGSAEFNSDMNEMRNLTKNRTREQVRIASFWEDGGGTSCPPGHWNAIAFTHIRQARFSLVRQARVLAYMNTAMMDACIACWETKYYYITARPHQIDPSVTMSAGLPNFPGYPSGHSAFSGAAATVLGHFFPTAATTFTAYSLEAAESRIYSRIHVRADCTVGTTQGNNVGQIAVQKAAAEQID